MYMFYFDACTYSATHPSKSYTDWLLAVTHPRSQHSAIQGNGISEYGAQPWLPRREVDHAIQVKNFLSTTKYHNKQLEPAKENPDACDCVWIDGRSQLKT